MLIRTINEIALIFVILSKKLFNRTKTYLRSFRKYKIICDKTFLYIKHITSLVMSMCIIAAAVYCLGTLVAISIKSTMDKPQYNGVILDMKCDLSGNNCDLIIEDDNGKQIKTHTTDGYMYKRLYENRKRISLIDFK